jgi:hypothetical protein
VTATTEAPPAIDAAPVEVAPEIVAAQSRLDRIDPELVSPELRQSVLRAAQRAILEWTIQEAIADAQRAVDVALAAEDITGAADAAMRLAALRSLPAGLPVIPDDGAAAGACLARGRVLVDAALATLPTLPVLAYQLERDAFDSVPRRPGDKLQGPVCVDGDIEADAALQNLASERAGIIRSVTIWYGQADGGRSDVLELLAAVSGLQATCQRHAEATRRVIAQVDAANASRTARRLEWTWPHGSTTTPAVEALAKFRKTAGLAARAVEGKR